MTPEQQRELAIDCGAEIRPHPLCEAITLFTFSTDELAAYTAAVEVSLLKRIIEVECNFGWYGVLKLAESKKVK